MYICMAYLVNMTETNLLRFIFIELWIHLNHKLWMIPYHFLSSMSLYAYTGLRSWKLSDLSDISLKNCLARQDFKIHSVVWSIKKIAECPKWEGEISRSLTELSLWSQWISNNWMYFYQTWHTSPIGRKGMPYKFSRSRIFVKFKGMLHLCSPCICPTLSLIIICTNCFIVNCMCLFNDN